MIELAMAFLSSFSKIMQVAKPSELIPIMEFFLEKAKFLKSEEDTVLALLISKSLSKVLEPSAEELNEFVEQAQKDPKTKPSFILAKLVEAAKSNLAKDPSLDQPLMTPKDIASIEELANIFSRGEKEALDHLAGKNRNGKSVN